MSFSGRLSGVLDGAIRTLSPAWGLSRLQARTATRAYEAASGGRRGDGWDAPQSSANAEIGPALDRVRARSRQICRDNPWGISARFTLPANIVGSGITPRLPSGAGSKLDRQAVMDDWRWFSDQCDPERLTDAYGLQHLAVGTVVEAGECITLLVPRPADWGLKIPLQIITLEPDYLDTARTQMIDGGGFILQGVEYDAFGRRRAYWLFDEHPGDMALSVRGSAYRSRRVPAELVAPMFDRLRPGQVRGMPWLTPVAMRLRDLDDIENSRRMREKVAACFAVFVRRARSNAPPLAAGNGPDGVRTDQTGRRLEKIAPGMITYIQSDEDVDMPNLPNPDDGVHHMYYQLHAVAAGLGMTFEQLTGILSDVNYTSHRVGQNQFGLRLDHWQWHMAVPQWCSPVWGAVQRTRRILGRPGADIIAEWSAPARPTADPVKEAKALRDNLRLGRITWDQMVAADGNDPERQFAGVLRDRKMFDDGGVVLDGDPARVNGSGGLQSAPAKPQPAKPAPAPMPRGTQA